MVYQSVEKVLIEQAVQKSQAAVRHPLEMTVKTYAGIIPTQVGAG
jgi:hypothetical protein